MSPRFGEVGDVNELGSGGDYGDGGLSTDADCGHASGGAGSQVGGAKSMVLGQQELGLYYVLSERSHVVVGRDGGPDFDCGVVDLCDDLDHYHGVESVRYGIAGIDPGGLVGKGEGERRTLGRANGVGGAHGHAVHGGSVVVGDRAQGPDRCGRDSAERVLNGDLLRVGGGEGADLVQGVIVAVGCLVEGDVLEVVAASVPVGVGHRWDW